MRTWGYVLMVVLLAACAVAAAHAGDLPSVYAA